MTNISRKMYQWHTADGQLIEVPAVTITSGKEGPHAVITAGVHGCEYPPILAAAEFIRETDPEDIRGSVTVVTICAVPSFEARTPFVVPQDGKNPNRCFPGREDGSYTECLTWHLFHDIISGADFHLDLHCGDMTETLAPYCEYAVGYSEEVDRKSREMAAYAGARTVIESDWRRDDIGLPPGLNYVNSSRHGIPSLMLEAGQMGMSDRESVETQLFCIRNVLRHFGILSGEAVKTEDTKTFVLYVEVDAPERGIFIRCVEPGTDVLAGQKLGDLYDYFGQPICEIKAPVDGRILYLTSPVSVTKGGFILNMADAHYM